MTAIYEQCDPSIIVIYIYMYMYAWTENQCMLKTRFQPHSRISNVAYNIIEKRGIGLGVCNIGKQ